jgi:RNA polymerase sigma-70 factor (ECF subfamily)
MKRSARLTIERIAIASMKSSYEVLFRSPRSTVAWPLSLTRACSRHGRESLPRSGALRENRRVTEARTSGPKHRSREDQESENHLLDALQDGDAEVFSRFVRRWSGLMLSLALAHVASRAVAEEVVQEAWLVVLRDFARFERRSALRTWVLGIVVNLARSRARSEKRSVPVPMDVDMPAVDPARFLSPDSARWPDHWAIAPVPWPTPEDALLAGEVRGVMLRAVADLPPSQREVLVLRDLEGASAEETCNVLGVSDTNQRVLLHRARSRIRNAVETYYAAAETT